ncbi:MAG TPA: ribosome maturation factor RimM [Herpetosiphonaceae bacterium]
MSQAPNPDDFLLVGRITTPHGVKGNVKLALVTTRPEHLSRIKQVFLGPSYQQYTLQRAHEHKFGVFVLHLAEVATRDDAEALRGAEVHIRASEAAPLDEDEYFIHDLIGLQVRTIDGQELGSVADVIETGANDVLIVRKVGSNDILIPMVREVVHRLDVAGKLIEVAPLDKLLPE